MALVTLKNNTLDILRTQEGILQTDDVVYYIPAILEFVFHYSSSNVIEVITYSGGLSIIKHIDISENTISEYTTTTITKQLANNDVLSIIPVDGNWEDVKSVSIINGRLTTDINSLLYKIQTCQKININHYTSNITIPITYKFPNMLYFRAAVNIGIIDTDTFNNNINHVDCNGVMDISKVAYYTSLNYIKCKKTGIFENMPLRDYKYIEFIDHVDKYTPSETYTRYGDVFAEFINDLFTNGYNYGYEDGVYFRIIIPGYGLNQTPINFTNSTYTTTSWINITSFYTAIDLTTLSNIPYVDVLSCKRATNLINITNIKTLRIDNSDISNDLNNVALNINSSVEVQHTMITTYTKDTRDEIEGGRVGFTCYQIVWYNCTNSSNNHYNKTTSEIPVQALIDLIDDIYYACTNTVNQPLNHNTRKSVYINQANPPITDSICLWQIDHLNTPIGQFVTDVSSPYFGLPGYGCNINYNS